MGRFKMSKWNIAMKQMGNRFLWSKDLQQLDAKVQAWSKDSAGNPGTRLAVSKAYQVWSKDNSAKCNKEKSNQALKAVLPDLLYDIAGPKPALPKLRTYSTNPIQGGNYIGHRGDNRPPFLISQTGFNFWPDAKTVLKGQGPAGWLKVKLTEKGNLATFADYVRQATARDRPTVSTSLVRDCGGYTPPDYFYKFKIPSMKEEILSDVLPEGWTCKWPLSPVVYMSSGSARLSSSTAVIGINLNMATGEVVFLAKIKPEWITDYWENAKWNAMPKEKITLKELQSQLDSYNEKKNLKSPFRVSKEDFKNWDE